MPLSRVAIAAVFLVIGAILVVPMFMSPSSSSPAAFTSPGVTASAGASASRPPGHHPSPSHTTRRPSTPPATPPAPLKVTIGAVRCPGRTVQVTVVNESRRTEDYAITTDGSISVADRIVAGATRRSTVNVREDHTTTIEVTWHNVPVRSADRHADCVRKTSHQTLPHTGPGRGMIFARVATGLAAVLTGVIVFWYGRQWPRRRDTMFGRDR